LYEFNLKLKHNAIQLISFRFQAVDMISKEVIDIVDLPVCPGNEPTATERPIPPPQEPHEYDPRVLPQDYYRTDVKPLQITQPKGPSFKINGNSISWQNWEMIVGYTF